MEEEDKMRLVARLSADYMLRSLKMIGDLAHGELLTGLVNLALVQANVGHLDRMGSGFPPPPNIRLDSIPPDEVLGR